MDDIEFDYDGSIRTVTRKGVQIWPHHTLPPAPAPTNTDTNESKQDTTERKQ